METILPISLKLHISPNTLGCYGLIFKDKHNFVSRLLSGRQWRRTPTNNNVAFVSTGESNLYGSEDHRAYSIIHRQETSPGRDGMGRDGTGWARPEHTRQAQRRLIHYIYYLSLIHHHVLLSDHKKVRCLLWRQYDIHSSATQHVYENLKHRHRASNKGW